MATADALTRSVWKRSGGKGCTDRNSLVLDCGSQEQRISPESSVKSQTNSERPQEMPCRADLIVPEINRALFLDYSAEKDHEAARTHYTDNNSSLFNSSLKSSLVQKSLLNEMEEMEVSEESQDMRVKVLPTKLIISGPLFPFKLSPKVHNQGDTLFIGKTKTSSFIKNSASATDSEERVPLRRDIFKPQPPRNRGIWLLKEDSSVSLQVGSHNGIDCRSIHH